MSGKRTLFGTCISTSTKMYCISLYGWESILLQNTVTLHIILRHYKCTLVLHFNDHILMAFWSTQKQQWQCSWQASDERLVKGFTPRRLLSITSQVGGYPGERRGRERKGGERKTIGTWPTSTSLLPVEVGGERRDSQKGRRVSRIDLWGLDLLCLFTPSITQIIRSEKQSGREEGRSVWWWDWWIDVSLGESVHCSIRCRQMSQGQVWRGNDRPE